MTPEPRRAVLLARTEPRCPAIVPEVELQLVDDLVGLWSITGEDRLAGRVLDWLGRSRSRVLLGDPGRAYLPTAGWVELAAYDVPTTRDLEGVESKRVRVFSPAPR